MSTQSPVPATDPHPATRPAPRPRRRGRVAALVAAGGLLVGAVGVAVPATTAATAATAADWQPGSTQTWPYGRSSGSGSGGSYGSGSSGSVGGSTAGGTSSTTTSTTAATTAQERGVALIDTVLSDGEAAGTGVVLTSDGEVLTNYHVVEGSTSIKVTIASTGTTYPATVVGADQQADIALLQLKGASGLTVATIDDDTVSVGDDVTAVGNAGGTGTLSAAAGEVTDLSTSITTASEGTVAGETLTKLIETDADVVPGDSGGPLLDAEGEVVGIDTAASSGGEIDGYAVPVATALAVVTQIRSGDETTVVRIGPAAFLGVQVGSATGTTGYPGSAAGSSEGTGAPVAGVLAGGAAAQAGLAAGDTITRVGSTTIDDASDLTAALATRQPGDRVGLTWTTADGGTRSATVTLGSSPVN